MERSSRTTTLSFPPKLYRMILTTAKSKGMTNSELFREAFRRYLRDEEEWETLLSYGRRKAKKMGKKTERAVERLIDAGRT